MNKKLAKQFADKLVKDIYKHNKILTKDSDGCWITDISMSYTPDGIKTRVSFQSNDADIKYFICESEITVE